MKNMTQGNVTKLIMAFAIPVLLGNVFQQFYTMADTMMVGQILGVNSLAAIGASASLSNLVIGLCTGVSMGVSIMIAQYYGARDEEGMKKAAAVSVTDTILHSGDGGFLSDHYYRWTVCDHGIQYDGEYDAFHRRQSDTSVFSNHSIHSQRGS